MSLISPSRGPSSSSQTAERWTLGPLSWGIEAADFARWLADAGPGERIVYAGGPALPRSLAVVQAVRSALGAGQISAHQRRCEGRIEYIAERKVEPAAGKSAAAGGVGIELNDEARAVFALLEREAKAGRPCPSDAVIALALQLGPCRRAGGKRGKGAERARYLVGKLARLGMIRVTAPTQPGGRRIITILATGFSTGGVK